MSEEKKNIDPVFTSSVTDTEVHVFTEQAWQNYKKEEEERREYIHKKIFKIGSIALFLLVMFIFASIAWFTMSREVENGGMQMTSSDLPFELEVRGNVIENSSIMTIYSIFTDEFANGVQQEDGEGNLVNIFRTSGNDEKIVWRKESTSTDYLQGLSPGSKGSLTFYVIPNQTGELNAYFKFNIRGYHAYYENETLSELIEITDDMTDSSELASKGITSVSTKQKALDYVNGHILFFKNYDETNKVYSDFCGNDELDFNDFISGNDKTVTKGVAYPVTVYWIWVNDFGDMFLPTTSTYAYDPILADSNTDDRNAIFDYLEDDDNTVFSGMSQSAILNALQDVQDTTSGTFRNSLSALTKGYDNADLEIGNNINYILIEMTASSEEE